MSAHDHSHGHSGASKPLAIALVITSAVVVIEFVGALLFNSLVLAADAAHMLADAFSLGIAVIAQRIAARPSSDEHSYGWRRAEVIAAEINAFLLLAASTVVVIEAVRRFGSSNDVSASGLIAVAAVGLIANGLSTTVLMRSGRENLNVRSAALHTLSDAAGAVAAVIAGVVIAAGGSSKADAISALVISVLIVWAAFRLLRDTIRVLLEATPAHLDIKDVRATLEADASVSKVHDLHVWTVAPGAVSLSAHIAIEGEVTLHQAQAEGARLKQLLADRFDVNHSTLELECHPCADELPHH